MMDPVSALLLAMCVAGYFTKNVYQDAVFKARGEDPPSFRREQARRERRAQRDGAVHDGPGRQFWRNAWADAVASADERRARAAAKAAEKRRAKWAEQDAAAAEDEAYAINERLTDDPAGPTSHTGSAVNEHMLWACEQCGREMRNAGPDGYPDDERVCHFCRIGVPLPDERPCHFCRSTFPAAELWATRTAHGATVDACRPCWDDHNRTMRGAQSKPTEPDSVTQCASCSNDVRVRDTSPIYVDGMCLLVCPPCRLRRAEGDPTDNDSSAEIIQFADWQRPAASDTAKENDLSAEITGLRSAVTYAQGGVTAANQAAAQAEVAIASLQAGETTGEAVAHLHAAMEGHHLNVGHYTAASTELTNQLQVTEQYEANRDAGSREFVTSD